MRGYSKFLDKAGYKRHRSKFTKVWYLLVRLKYCTSSWNKLKDLKDSNPVEIADYSVGNNISGDPDFAWWVGDFLKKQDQIISEVKSSY